MLENLLKTCGLNASEQTVFLWLMNHGESIASVIAKGTQLKRTTAYAALESLVKQGLLNKQKRSGVTYFKPINPQLVPRILKQRAQEQYEQVSRAAKLIGEQLEHAPAHQSYGAYSIESFESVDAVYVMLKDSIQGGDFDAFLNPQMFGGDGPFKALVAEYLQATQKNQPHIREIMVDGPTAQWYIKRIKNPNHQVKLLPSDSQFFSDIILIKDSVVLTHYDSKQETCIKIAEQKLFTSMSTLFELLWERL